MEINTEDTAFNIQTRAYENDIYKLQIPVKSFTKRDIIISKYDIPSYFQNSLKIGNKVSIFDNDIVKDGVISKRDQKNIYIYSSKDLVNPLYVKRNRWWSLGIGFTYLVSKESLVEATNDSANITVEFKVPNGTPKGTIRWSLYYSETDEDYFEVIKSCDWERTAYSTVSLNNYLWKRGYYKVKAKRLSPSLSAVINENEYKYPYQSLEFSSISIKSPNRINL